MDKDIKEKLFIAAAALGAGMAIGAGTMYALSGASLLREEPLPERRQESLQESELKAKIGFLERKILELKENASTKMTKSFSSCASVASFYSMSSDDDDFYDLEEEIGDEWEERQRKPDERLQVFIEIDDLFDKNEDEAAYQQLVELREEHENDANWAWRMSKACHRKSTLDFESGSDGEKNFIFRGIEYAEKALELDSECADAHKWFAINIGSRGKFLSIKDKIQDGYTFKEHLEKAIALKPLDYVLYHLLGRFCFEVSQLSLWERSIASTLFASPPSSTFEETLEYFERADALNPKPPGWKENKLFRAKTLILMKKFREAADVLKAGLEIPTKSQEGAIHQELETLFKKYAKYRDQA